MVIFFRWTLLSTIILLGLGCQTNQKRMLAPNETKTRTIKPETCTVSLLYRLKAQQKSKFHRFYAADYLFRSRSYTIKLLRLSKIKKAQYEQVKQMIEENSPSQLQLEVKGAFFKQRESIIEKNSDFIALSMEDETPLVSAQNAISKTIRTQFIEQKTIDLLEFLPFVSLSTENELVDLDKADIITDLNRKIDLSRSKFTFERKISPCH